MTYSFSPIPGAVHPAQAIIDWRLMSAGTRGAILVLAALALGCLVALIWTLCFRKRKRLVDPRLEQLTAGSGRRRRRGHRRRNPTRAETGGLPPPQSQKTTNAAT
jgi:hypothetical protein